MNLSHLKENKSFIEILTKKCSQYGIDGVIVQESDKDKSCEQLKSIRALKSKKDLILVSQSDP